jgi:uncharacterized membrane protein YedE/YeeE
MTTLRDLIAEQAPLVLALGGFAIGIAFGAVVQATNFCVMGAVSDMMMLGDKQRLRAWLLAAAAAIVGAHALDALGIVSLDQSMYRSARLNWAGNLAGGLMFGFGMVLAGGCASRNLVRAGAGDLRAALTLIVLGLFAYMAVGGIFGPWRAALETATAVDLPGGGKNLAAIVAYATDANFADVSSGATGEAGIALLVAGALLVYCFRSPEFRRSRMHILSGLGVGLAVIAGWALTGLAYDEFAAAPHNPVSLSFVKPTGDAMEWLERYTALGLPAFGVATVLGTLIGAFVAAMLAGRFALATFKDPADTLRNLSGAALMGVGGVMALGCTIGQGVTGLSTLAPGSLIAVAAIVTGAVIALRALERFTA